MNLSEMISQCRSLLNEPAARLFSDAELTRWINFGYKDFVNKAMPCENVKAFTVVANQTRYTKPSNALLLEEVLWEERYAIAGYDIKDFRARITLNPTVRGSIPWMYCEYPGFSNAEIQLYPIPSSAGQTTTVVGALTDSATTIPVVSTQNFPTSGWLIIDNEQIWYNNYDSTNFLQCERGKGATTAATHSNGATVNWAKLTMRYTMDPALLSGSDTPLLPSAWHEALTLYAAKIGFEKMGKLPEAQLMLAQYENICQKANNVRQSRTYDQPYGWQDPMLGSPYNQ